MVSRGLATMEVYFISSFTAFWLITDFSLANYL
jgi:hypothetical protein